MAVLPSRLLLRRRAATASAARSLLAAFAPASVPPENSERKPNSSPNEPAGSPPDNLYRRLSVLGGAPDGAVFKALNMWTREGRRASANELRSCVVRFRKYGRYKHALEIMDWMTGTRGMNMSHSNQAVRIDLIAKVHGAEAAEEYFKSLPLGAQNYMTYGSLLNFYCASKLEDKARNLYQKMVELQFASRTLVHNNMMNLYKKLGHYEKVLDQYQQMKADGITPDSHTCCIVMTTYSAMNDMDSVEKVLKEMEDGNPKLNWNVYWTLAFIYSSAGLIDRAESALLKVEKLAATNPTLREPYEFLISLYASTGNLKEVNRVWALMKSSLFKLTNKNYLVMLHALKKLGDITSMKQIYAEWESNHATFDVKLTNVLIGALLKTDANEAVYLYQKALEMGAKFDEKTCDLFVTHYLEKHEMPSVLVWLENLATLEKPRVKPDQEKIDMLLSHFEEEADAEGAERLCACLRKLGYPNAGPDKSL